MIVIVIMGVIYTLGVTSFPKKEDKVEHLSLLNLKEYLQSLEYEKEVRFLCLDECESCDILVDGDKNTTVESFIDDTVHMYRYDYLLGSVEKRADVYFNTEDVQENVCFSYTVDKQGIGDQVLVEYKDKVYDFSTYLTPTKKYASLDEAIDAKSKLVEEVIK